MSKTALLSVYDKTGLAEFARALVELGFDLVSSGGTSKALAAAGIPHRQVQEVTGFPEMMDGRVKTLHPMILGGILANRAVPGHMDDLVTHQIGAIDLVVCNLYPFTVTVASGADWDTCIENIDVGGPTMVRAAAKNHAAVGVVVDPADYPRVVTELRNHGGLLKETCLDLAKKAFAHTAAYDTDIAEWISDGGFRGMLVKLAQKCSYGENAWQTPAGVYSTGRTDPLGFSQFDLIEGAPASYNNWVEVADRQPQTLTHIAAGFERNFGGPPFIAIGTKHGNCCGAAVGDNPAEVIRKMLAGNLKSIHGGLVMTNFAIDSELAEIIRSWNIGNMKRRILDVISAPDFTDEAISILKRKDGKCRFFVNPNLVDVGEAMLDEAPRLRYIRGGFLREPNYTYVLDFNHPEFSWPFGEPELEVRESAVLAWAVGSTSNSNTMTLVRGGQLLGNGVGQQDRVGAAQLALKIAADAGHGFDESGRFLDWYKSPRVVAYSDSFMPFRDAAETLLAAGVWAVIATNGSINDQEVEDVFATTGCLGWLPDSAGRGFFNH
ncbi:MAG TPA: bifunctional phosphoribosylaminoimidazolecarboxamide formyltransferase/IMP cyclohydrolase [Candidatus Saccharimonadales bacterium]|nr:bifunctional phosphoribosylaminoimidazolecarboxamide formyltransferase/IMP cyclohydrolase [Candidatus Saccharimonadales bacterium]